MAYFDVRFFADTLGVSTSMQVLLPQDAGSSQIGQTEGGGEGPFPVLYLLHGWSDDDSIWMRRTSIERYAMERGLAVVMPRGELSYYQNMASGMAFYDFIAEEVPRLCENWFPIRKDRAGTFAAGLSMGGYGAFLLGLSRPDRYGAVASLSGALDVADLKNRFDEEGRRAKMAAIFGTEGEFFDAENRDLFRLTEKAAASGTVLPRMYQWCGTEDFLYKHNLRFRDHVHKLRLPLEYLEGPGDHSWTHWDREIQPVLDWMLEPLPSRDCNPGL